MPGKFQSAFKKKFGKKDADEAEKNAPAKGGNKKAAPKKKKPLPKRKG